MTRIKAVVVVVVLAVAATMVGPAAGASPADAGRAPGATTSPVDVFTYSSGPGDWIGQGAERTFTAADSTFSGGVGYRNHVAVDITGQGEWWTLWFAAPDGAPLTPGTYEGATRFPFQAPGVPGLSMFGTGRGCNQSFGSFTVHSIAFDASGGLSELSADFVQHCETPTAPALVGRIRYRVPATTRVDLLGVGSPSTSYRASAWSSPATLTVGSSRRGPTLDGTAEFVARPGALGTVGFASRPTRFGPGITLTLTDPTLGPPVRYRTVLVVPLAPGTVLGLALAPPGSPVPALLYKVTAPA